MFLSLLCPLLFIPKNNFHIIKRCNKIFILLFFIGSFSVYAGEPIVFNEKTQSIQLDKKIFITPVTETDNLSGLNYQLVNKQNSGIKFFLDQTPFIYVYVHDENINSNTIDSILLNFNGYEFKFKGYSNFFIEGLSKGDHELEIKFTHLDPNAEQSSVNFDFKAI